MIIIKKILFANDMNEHALFLYISIEAYVYDAGVVVYRKKLLTQTKQSFLSWKIESFCTNWAHQKKFLVL